MPSSSGTNMRPLAQLLSLPAIDAAYRSKARSPKQPFLPRVRLMRFPQCPPKWRPTKRRPKRGLRAASGLASFNLGRTHMDFNRPPPRSPSKRFDRWGVVLTSPFIPPAKTGGWRRSCVSTGAAKPLVSNHQPPCLWRYRREVDRGPIRH